MPQNAHTLASFDQALRKLHNSLLTMASLSQRNLENAYHGLLERNSELCREVIGQDDEVDELEREVDREGLELIVRYAPVAMDLRRILASMRIAGNLERVSDHAVSISRRARKLNKHPEVAETKMLEPAYEMAMDMLKRGLRAFTEGDVNLAMEVIKQDDELDSRHNKLLKDLTRGMETNTANLRAYLHLSFVVRSLERIGDHAVNISEDAVFIEKGHDIRHADKPEPVSAFSS